MSVSLEEEEIIEGEENTNRNISCYRYNLNRVFSKVGETREYIRTSEFRKDCVNWLTFFILGFVNNVGYVIVISASQDISNFYGQERFYGVIIWANIILGIFFQVLNAFVLRIFSHSLRIILVSIMFLGGVVIVPFCTVIFGRGSAVGFWVTTVSILFVGAGCALGANVLVGYMKIFRHSSSAKAVLSAWGSGTGFAGLGGTGIYLILNSIGLGIFFKFGIIIPLIFLYCFVFLFCIFEPGRASPCPKVITKLWSSIRRKIFLEDFEFEKMEDEVEMENIEDFEINSENQENQENVEKKIVEEYRATVDVKETLDEIEYNQNMDHRTMEMEENKVIGDEEDLEIIEEKLIQETKEWKPVITECEVIQKEENIEDPNSGIIMCTNNDETNSEEDNNISSNSENLKCSYQEFRENVLDVLKGMYWIGGNLFLIYWFEYLVCTCCAEKIFAVEESEHSSNWSIHNAYPIFSCCYQVGVFISRSSLCCFKIRKIWIFTIVQFLFLLFWIALAKWRFLSDEYWIWFLFGFMVTVGLLGGASYVNGYYVLLNEKKFKKEKNREVAANLCVICDNMGIVFSSLFTILLDNTFLKN